VACNDLPQPASLIWDCLVHSLSQLRLDFLYLRPHAVAPGLPLELEGSPSRFAAHEGKAQESEGLRSADTFAAIDVQIREAFTVRVDGAGVVEQIDGAIELDRHVYLVEVKWHDAPLGPGETAHHLVRVFSRDGARGIFISASGYTTAAVEQFRQALTQKVVLPCTLQGIVEALDAGTDIAELLRKRTTRQSSISSLCDHSGQIPRHQPTENVFGRCLRRPVLRGEDD
jgi:hypothetical protein